MLRIVRHPGPHWFYVHVNSGGPQRPYIAFEYTLASDPGIETVRVDAEPDADEAVQMWLEDIRAGLAEGLNHATIRDQYGRLCGVKSMISLLNWHPVDTTSEGTRQLCRGSFALDLCHFTYPLPSFDPVWRTDLVVRLTQAIAERGAYDRLPILADALEEAGCENSLLLAHCRECPDHTPSCWAVDWILSPPNQPDVDGRRP
jgi:hypothetical protein